MNGLTQHLSNQQRSDARELAEFAGLDLDNDDLNPCRSNPTKANTPCLAT